MLGQQSGGAPRSTSEPTPTVTTDGAISLIQPSIIEYYGQSHAREVTEPLSTILSNRKHGFVKPTLVKYYGQSHSADVDAPLPALTTKARYGLADPILVELNHGASAKGPKDDDRRSHSVDQPLGSLTTSRGIGLAQPDPHPNRPDRCKRQPRPAPRATGPDTHDHRQAVPRAQLRRTRRAGAAHP